MFLVTLLVLSLLPAFTAYAFASESLEGTEPAEIITPQAEHIETVEVEETVSPTAKEVEAAQTLFWEAYPVAVTEAVKYETEVTQVALMNADAQYLTLADTVDEIRSNMMQRINEFTVYAYEEYDASITEADIMSLPNVLLEEAFTHTGDPQAGDYLRYHLRTSSFQMEHSHAGEYIYYTIRYSIGYMSDTRQEMLVTSRINALMESLDLQNQTDIGKVVTIYDYITKNVRYDYEGLENDMDMLKYSAYGALWERSAVCQGYATLFYRLALTAGLDARVITGIASNGEATENHAWNIVKLDNKYYNLDATWDSVLAQQGLEYLYFLKANESFCDHTGEAYYQTEVFQDAHPMAEKDYEYFQGYVDFTDGDFVFKISMTEAVLSKYTGDSANVVIPESANGRPVTTIDNQAFHGNTAIERVTFPASVTAILDGWYTYDGSFGALAHCTNLTEVIIPEDSKLKTIGEWAFYNCEKLNKIELPTSIRTLKLSCFNKCKGLTQIDLPEGLEVIGQNAFSNTGLKTIMIPASCTDLHWAHTWTNLESFAVANGNRRYRVHEGVLYDSMPPTGDYTGWTLINYPMKKLDTTYRVPDYCTHIWGDTIAVSSWPEALETLYIGNAISAIGAQGGDSFSRIECIIIPDDSNPLYKQEKGMLLTKDGKTLVQVARGKEVTIPYGITAIEEYVFWLNEDISQLTIPETVSKIGGGAFGFCENLKWVRFEGDVPVFEDNPFWCTSTVIYYPKGNETWTASVQQNYGGTIAWVAYDKKDGRCGDDLTWEITDDGTLIISGMGDLKAYSSETDAPWYEWSDEIETVVVRNGVTSIGENVFSGLTLSTLVMEGDTTRLSENAFAISKNMTIYANDGTDAQAYAAQHGLEHDKIKSYYTKYNSRRGTVTLRNMEEGWSAMFVAYNDGQLVYVDFANNAKNGRVFASPSVAKYDSVKLFILTADQWKPVLALADLLN